MSDSLIHVTPTAIWLAQNTQRHPSEALPVVHHPAARGGAGGVLRCTHIEIPQVAERLAVILAQPAWCWGGEMGVNEAGVAILRQDLHTRTPVRAPALLGADLLRLGLERTASSAAAVALLVQLLDQHGQGGPDRYGRGSAAGGSRFLVADAREAWLLETAGRTWTCARLSGARALCAAPLLHQPCRTGTAPGAADFAAAQAARWRPALHAARWRQAAAQSRLDAAGAPDWAGLLHQLRAHAPDPAGVTGLCRHAGWLHPLQTTGSLLLRLAPDATHMLWTGTSAPCLSIFRPAAFSGTWSVLTRPEQQLAAPLWRRHEWLHRWALADPGLRARLHATREQLEPQVLDLMMRGEPQRADRLAASWHKVLFESLRGAPPPQSAYWRRMGRADGMDIARATLHPDQ
jgi:secernin